MPSLIAQREKYTGMKLKRLPEDFQVDEISAFQADGGAHALYRLTKRGMGTFEAIEAIRRRWDLQPDRISYAGLKDRYAVTSQYLTVLHGPRRGLRETSFELAYLGQASRRFSSEDISANHFRIVLRDLSKAEIASARIALEEIARDGLANYFDRQRFGSVGESGEFVAQPWCRGDYERALWLALADANDHDRPQDRAEKELLRVHWGDWQTCLPLLTDSSRRRVVEYLADRPGDFRAAITRIDHHLRSMYLAAFQSFLWNEMLAEWLREECRGDEIVEVFLHDRRYPFPRCTASDKRAVIEKASLPLPSARLHLAEGKTRGLIERVLERHGLDLRQLRVKYPRDTFFSKGDRLAIVCPANLTHSTGADDIYPQREILTLSFELPRGSYATVLVARMAVGDRAQPEQ